MKLSGPDQVKTVTLSDGSIATVRRPRGRDLVRAQDVAGNDNKFKFTCAMLAQVTQLNGEPCVMEDIMELWAAHRCAVERDGRRFFIIERSIFALLVEWGFGFSELMEMEVRDVASWYETILSVHSKRRETSER